MSTYFAHSPKPTEYQVIADVIQLADLNSTHSYKGLFNESRHQRRMSVSIGFLLLLFLLTKLPAIAHAQTSIPDISQYSGTDTDVTSIIQASFDAIGTAVEIPAGTYLVGCTKSLSLPSNKTIYGQGVGVTTLVGCDGIQVPVESWSYTGSAAPYTVTVDLSEAVLPLLQNYYLNGPTTQGLCPIYRANQYSQIPATFYGTGGLESQYLVNQISFPETSNSDCNVDATSTNTFTFTTNTLPTNSSGTGGVLILGTPMMQDVNIDSGVEASGIVIHDITLSGGCSPTSCSTNSPSAIANFLKPSSGLFNSNTSLYNVEIRDVYWNAFNLSKIQNWSLTAGALTNIGINVVGAVNSSQINVSNNNAGNCGWVVPLSGSNWGCGIFNETLYGSGYSDITLDNNVIQCSSANTYACGAFAIFSANTSGSDTQENLSQVDISGNKLYWNGATSGLFITAFADQMSIYNNTVDQTHCNAGINCGETEVAGSNLNIYGNVDTNIEYALGQLQPNTVSHIYVHGNTLHRTNSGGFFNISGYQSHGTGSCLEDDIQVYGNSGWFTFGAGAPTNAALWSFAVGWGEGGTQHGDSGSACILTNYTAHDNQVEFDGTVGANQKATMFILGGLSTSNAYWNFNSNTAVNDTIHFLVEPNTVVSNMTVSGETYSGSFLQDDSGGTYTGPTHQ